MRLFALVAVPLVVSSCASVPPPPPPPPAPAAAVSPAEANKAVVRRLFDAFNSGDFATISMLFAPDIVLHMLDGSVKTAKDFPPVARELKDRCPMCGSLKEQRNIQIDQMVAEGNLVFVRSTWTGLYTGTFQGVAVEKRPAKFLYGHVYRVEGGLIHENWVYGDRGASAEALGIKLAPVPQAASPAPGP